MPFWFPALWIGATLALVPQAPWLTLLGYHALCLGAAARHPRPRWGHIPAWSWPVSLGLGAAAVLILRVNHGSPALPLAGAQTFLAHWPGGFPSYVAYTLTLNSVCEEVYWRHALPLHRPRWNDAQHGAAFGLHHVVANGIVFGWWSTIPAFLYTAAGGWLAQKVTRRVGGLGLAMLGHSLLNALSFAWLAGRL